MNQYADASQIDPIKVWILLDRSGSMHPLREAVIEGTNRFLDEQCSGTGECRITLVQFDTGDPFEIVIDDVPIADAPELNAEIYQPRAATPLYDAIGALIGRADRRLQRRGEDGHAPEDQTILIYTDGFENSSTDYDRARILELIEERSKQGWQFVFMGANQDAYAESIKIGIVVGNTANFAATPAGVRESQAAWSAGVSTRRSMTRAERRQSTGGFFDPPPAPGTEPGADSSESDSG